MVAWKTNGKNCVIRLIKRSVAELIMHILGNQQLKQQKDLALLSKTKRSSSGKKRIFGKIYYGIEFLNGNQRTQRDALH